MITWCTMQSTSYEYGSRRSDKYSSVPLASALTMKKATNLGVLPSARSAIPPSKAAATDIARQQGMMLPTQNLQPSPSDAWEQAEKLAEGEGQNEATALKGRANLRDQESLDAVPVGSRQKGDRRPIALAGLPDHDRLSSDAGEVEGRVQYARQNHHVEQSKPRKSVTYCETPEFGGGYSPRQDLQSAELDRHQRQLSGSSATSKRSPRWASQLQEVYELNDPSDKGPITTEKVPAGNLNVPSGAAGEVRSTHRTTLDEEVMESGRHYHGGPQSWRGSQRRAGSIEKDSSEEKVSRSTSGAHEAHRSSVTFQRPLMQRMSPTQEWDEPLLDLGALEVVSSRLSQTGHGTQLRPGKLAVGKSSRQVR
jgi:hypothetical protein